MEMDDFFNLLLSHNPFPLLSVTNKQRGLYKDQVEYLSWREASGKWMIPTHLYFVRSSPTCESPPPPAMVCSSSLGQASNHNQAAGSLYCRDQLATLSLSKAYPPVTDQLIISFATI